MKIVSYSTRSSTKLGVCALQCTFTLKITRHGRDGQLDAYQCLNGCPWEKFCIMEVEILDHPKRWWAIKEDHCKNRGLCVLRSLFDLDNGTGWPCGWRGCIVMVIIVIHEKFQHFWNKKSGSLTMMGRYSTRSSMKRVVWALHGSFDL